MTPQLSPISVSWQVGCAALQEQVVFCPDKRFTASGSSELVTFSIPDVGKHAQRLAEQDVLHQFAKTIRSADEALGLVKDVLFEIKRELIEFVKQYPPYAQASPERISFLNSISGLRKQIEALVPYMTPDPGSSPKAPLFRASQAISSLADIRDRLDLPKIDQKTLDSEIADALPRVETALDRVARLRRDFADAIQKATSPNDAETTSLRLLLA